MSHEKPRLPGKAEAEEDFSPSKKEFPLGEAEVEEDFGASKTIEIVSEPTDEKLAKALQRLAPEYKAYIDQLEIEGKGMSEERRRKFLEFIADLNPKYLDFLNHTLEKRIDEAHPPILNKEGKVVKRDMDWEDLEQFAAEYEKRLEFFGNNFALPLSDKEAVEALMFLQKDKKEVAEAKVAAWRKLARQFDYTDKNNPEKDAADKPLVYLSRAGFTIKEKAPQVADQHNKSKKKKGLCYENWKYLQDWDFSDNPTQDEIRFFIPRLIPESTNLNFEEQQNLVKELADKIKKEHKELKNTDISMGEANQIANQILAHYNQTKERIPLNLNYVRTKTLRADGHRLGLGCFAARGLDCYYWDWGERRDSDLGLFLSGVEPLVP